MLKQFDPAVLEKELSQLVKPEELVEAKMAGGLTGESAAAIFLEKNRFTPQFLANIFSFCYGLEIVDAATITPTREALDMIPEDVVCGLNILPIRVDSRYLTVLIADPTDPELNDVLEIIEYVDKKELKFVLSFGGAAPLKQKIKEAYQGEGDPV